MKCDVCHKEYPIEKLNKRLDELRVCEDCFLSAKKIECDADQQDFLAAKEDELNDYVNR